jgi:hypothetical protein
MNIKRLLATAGLAAATSMAVTAGIPGTAQADVANTPVGELLAEKITCSDHGGVVRVTAKGGLPGTPYDATARGGLVWFDGFTSDASGAGSGRLTNVRPDVEPFIGLATVTVTAGGLSGQVTVWIDCPSNKGD